MLFTQWAMFHDQLAILAAALSPHFQAGPDSYWIEELPISVSWASQPGLGSVCRINSWFLPLVCQLEGDDGTDIEGGYGEHTDLGMQVQQGRAIPTAEIPSSVTQSSTGEHGALHYIALCSIQ